MTMLMWRLRSRSLGLLFGTMTALGVVMLTTRLPSWVGSWPATGIIVQIAGVYLALVVAAAGAWAGGAESRDSTAEQLAATAVSPWRRSTLELSALAIASAGSYLAVSAVAVARTVGKAGPGLAIGAGYWLSGLLAMLLCLALGWLLGRVLRGPVAVLVAVIAAFGTLQGPETAPFALVDGDPQWTSDVRVLVLKIALVSALLGVAIIMPASSGPGRRTHAIRATAAVAAAAIVGGCIVVGAPQVFRDPVKPLCIEDRLTVCVWPEQRVHLSMVQEVVARADRLPPEISFAQTNFSELGLRTRQVWEGDSVHFEHFIDGDWVATELGGGDGAAQVPAPFRLIDASPWAVASEIASRASWEGDECAAGAESSIRLRAWVEATLAGGGSPAYVMGGDPTMVEFRQQGMAMADPSIPEPDRAAWASEMAAHARLSCD